ncbi:zinc finger protein 62 homolog [Diachasma alloeum]|uniref:zinc finger protein 62 homolog n=1 Tax=Diachasma alloeum TaxID=454923 RepID=UPI0007382350|nr:zinc finger protein 62 homolog [Diachasma alloeum]
MLRQILSPSPETGDGSFAGYCSLIQPGIYNSYPSMLSPTIQHIVPTSSSYHPHSASLISLEQPTLDHLEIHVETHQCPNCGLDFRSVPKLNYHIRMCHQIIPKQEPNQMKYTCTYCGRVFPCLSHLRMHEVTHTNPQQMQQNNVLVNNVQMMQNEQNDQPFRCDKCQATFRYRTLLDRHKKMHTNSQDKPYVCPRCPMRFETRTLYNHHAKTHKQVNATVGSINSVQSSITDTQMDKPLDPPVSYPCDSCTKQFLTIESLTSHKAVHRSRPLVCDVCGKGFTHRKYYVVHQRIHTGERPYLCAMCGKSFTQASTLTVHRRYHTGERPYTCTLCGKGFVTRTIMLNHMKKH